MTFINNYAHCDALKTTTDHNFDQRMTIHNIKRNYENGNWIDDSRS